MTGGGGGQAFEWRQAEEQLFLGDLGTHAKEYHEATRRDELPGQRRRRLLRGYIAGCELRVDWGSLRRADCIAYARALLLIAERKRAA